MTAGYLMIQFILQLIVVFAGRHSGVFGEHTLEIKPEGLEETTAVNKSLHRWNPAFRVRLWAGYVWIYPTEGQFFIFRQNQCDGNVPEFLALLKSRIRGAAAVEAVS